MVGVAPDSDPRSLFSVNCSFKFFVSSDWSTGRVRPQSLDLGLMIDGSARFIFSHTSVLWSQRGGCVCVCVTFLAGWVWLRDWGGGVGCIPAPQALTHLAHLLRCAQVCVSQSRFHCIRYIETQQTGRFDSINSFIDNKFNDYLINC